MILSSYCLIFNKLITYALPYHYNNIYLYYENLKTIILNVLFKKYRKTKSIRNIRAYLID